MPHLVSDQCKNATSRQKYEVYLQAPRSEQVSSWSYDTCHKGGWRWGGRKSRKFGNCVYFGAYILHPTLSLTYYPHISHFALLSSSPISMGYFQNSECLLWRSLVQKQFLLGVIITAPVNFHVQCSMLQRRGNAGVWAVAQEAEEISLIMSRMFLLNI